MRRSTAEPLKTLIPKNLPPAFRIAMKLAEMEQHWSYIAGDALAKLTRPVSFDRQGLVVLCATPAAAQLLRLSEMSICSKVQKRWKVELQNIRPVVVNRFRREAAPLEEQRPVRIVRPNPDTVEHHYHHNKEVIERSDVALALARLRTVYHQRFSSRRNSVNQKKSTE